MTKYHTRLEPIFGDTCITVCVEDPTWTHEVLPALRKTIDALPGREQYALMISGKPPMVALRHSIDGGKSHNRSIPPIDSIARYSPQADALAIAWPRVKRFVPHEAWEALLAHLLAFAVGQRLDAPAWTGADMAKAMRQAASWGFNVRLLGHALGHSEMETKSWAARSVPAQAEYPQPVATARPWQHRAGWSAAPLMK
jgi:hypothetical protein